MVRVPASVLHPLSVNSPEVNNVALIVKPILGLLYGSIGRTLERLTLVDGTISILGIPGWRRHPHLIQAGKGSAYLRNI